jgi:hypothetical protein
MVFPPWLQTSWVLTLLGWLKAPFVWWARRRTDRQLLLNRAHRDDEYRHFVSPYGAVVWRSRRDPNVYLCPKCFEDGHHYVLQRIEGARDTRHTCPSCKAGYQVLEPYKTPPIPPSAPGGPNSWLGN